MVELLAPEHAGEGLAHDVAAVLAELGRSDAGVERIGLGLAGGEQRVEVLAHPRASRFRHPATCETETDGPGGPCRNRELDPCCRLGAHLLRIHCLGSPLDYPGVEPVLYVWRGVRGTPQAPRVGLVLGEEPFGLGVGPEREAPLDGVLRVDAHRTPPRVPQRLQSGFGVTAPP